MSKDERGIAFKADLKQLCSKYGLDLQAVIHTEDMGAGKVLLRPTIELAEIDGWQPPPENESDDNGMES